MATTKRTDIIRPTILQMAVAGAFAGMRPMQGSPVVVSSPDLWSNTAGEKVTVPYFGTLGEMEDVAEGDALTPAALTQTSEESSVQHSGKAFESTAWAQMAAPAGSDPYQEAARQFKEIAEIRGEKALITVASASLPAMTSDVYSATVPRTLDYDLVVDGRMLFGDEQDNIEMMVVHSKVLGDLYKLKDASGRPLLTDPNDLGIQRFAGIPLKVTDLLTPSSSKYTTLLLKRGALAWWYDGTPTVDTDKDILANTQVAAIHMYWVAHRYSRLPGKTKGGVAILKHN